MLKKVITAELKQVDLIAVDKLQEVKAEDETKKKESSNDAQAKPEPTN